MFYKNDEIPSNYNKIADFSDNYIVWCRESVLNSGVDYDVYIQFFTPSFGLLHIDNYRITKGTEYSLLYNYSTYGFTSADCDFSFRSYVPDNNEIIDNDYLRSDYTNIFICGFIAVFFFYFVFHKLSYLYRKGGI